MDPMSKAASSNSRSTSEIIIRKRDRRALSFEGTRIGCVRTPDGVTWLNTWDVVDALELEGEREMAAAFHAVPDDDAFIRSVVVGSPEHGYELPAHVSPAGALRMARAAGTAAEVRFGRWLVRDVCRPGSAPGSRAAEAGFVILEGGRL
jgi:hypothetical protein